MKQAELIQLIAKDTNLRRDAVRKVLRKLTTYMCVAMENNEPLRIGLGTFELQERGPKQVQDFINHKRYYMAPSNKLVYTPSIYVRTTVKKADLKLQQKHGAKKIEHAQ